MAYDKIEVFDGLDGVRAKLSMYIGSTGVTDGRAPRALVQMSQETLSNSLDEFVAGHGDTVRVEILEDNSLRVSDHGRGIPRGDGESFEHVINAFTKTHASGKFDDSAYSALGVAGTHGIGIKAVNAGSERLEVIVRRSDDEIYTVRFEKGQPVEKSIVSIGDLPGHAREWLAESTGSIITFLPDTGPISDDNPKPVLESREWPIDELLSRFPAAAFLNTGIKLELIDHRPEAKIEKTWHYPEGLKDFMIEGGADKNSVVSAEARVTIDDYDFHVSVAIAPGSGRFSAFANGVPTKDGGHHEDGFRASIGSAFSDFADLKRNEKIVTADVLEQTSVLLHVKVPAEIIEFEGQTKEKLGTARARRAVINAVKNQLIDAMHDNPKASDKLIDLAKASMMDRLAVQKTREQTKKMRDAGKKLGLEVSSKLMAASSKNPAEKELYITEGDSASNIGRDTKFQAIMPIRGKIKNVFEVSMAEALSNVEVSTITSTIGAGVYTDFDVDKMAYHKIILATDADDDGAHIQNLLIAMCSRLYPGMIDAGRLYAVQPPLYKATKYVKGEPTVKMFYSEYEMSQARHTLEGYDIQRYKGLGEMDEDEAHEALANPATRRLLRITQADAEESKAVLTMFMGGDAGVRKEWIMENVDFTVDGTEND